MINGKCPKCGAMRVPGPECPQCGVIYSRAEQASYSEHRHRPQQATAVANWKIAATDYSIDCTACKLEGGMEKKKVVRFPLFIRLIGACIALPSAFGMVAGFMAIIAPSRTPEAAGFGIIFGGGFLIFSAVGGLIGWLLLMRKKAFVCRRCGFMLDRA
jgi:ribosomal protein L32